MAIISQIQHRMQGVVACVTIAFASSFISIQYGMPVMVSALLLGMAFNFLYEIDSARPGIDYCAAFILRLSVGLLGVNVLTADLLDLGIGTVLMVIAGVVATIFFGYVSARLLGLDRNFGLLSGGAVAICGIAAAMTLSSVMPKSKEMEKYTSLTVVMVATIGSISMVLYPFFATYLELNTLEAGAFLGGSIHDVSHVVGAGYTISEEVGDTAMLVKMMRVALLVPVAWLFFFYFNKQNPAGPGNAKITLPWFLILFVGLVIVNNLGLIPTQMGDAAKQLSRAGFALAIAALGVKTSFKALMSAGWKPIALVCVESIFLGLMVLVWLLLG